MSAFLTSDTHFGHAKMIDFVRPDGEPLRPFASCEEMDETIIERWNAKVGKRDTVYHLGDVVIPRASLKLLSRLNGRKILIRGNHDQGALKDYLPYFEDVRGAFFHPCDSTFPGGLIFTHVPVHPSCLSGHYTGNVHGHLHCHRILDDNGQVDKRYFSACLETNDFAPIEFERVKDYFRDSRASNF